MSMSTKHFLFYDADGRITAQFSAPSARYARRQGQRYALASGHESAATHYVDVATRQVRAKRSLDIDQRTDGMTITLDGIPAGVTVATNGQQAVTNGAPLVITYDLPGTYEIRLSGHIEYLDRVEEVTVDDA
ncbi:hypothetical protein CTT34_01665 [Vreelandella aquamarina]|uniref:Uncharacterized protein n=2 Tax=Vreelandella aquamarina TaxID=77097 RepID=A0A857GGX4_9GAMM|nr:hypothetical protein CTT34_01665 [Halomonas meridiana]